MALTITRENDSPYVVGDRRQSHGAITFDTSYPTGGEAVTALDFGFTTLHDVRPEFVSGRFVDFDKTNSKLRLYTAVGTEATAASDQSSITVRYVAVGV